MVSIRLSSSHPTPTLYNCGLLGQITVNVQSAFAPESVPLMGDTTLCYQYVFDIAPSTLVVSLNTRLVLHASQIKCTLVQVSVRLSRDSHT